MKRSFFGWFRVWRYNFLLVACEIYSNLLKKFAYDCRYVVVNWRSLKVSLFLIFDWVKPWKLRGYSGSWIWIKGPFICFLLIENKHVRKYIAGTKEEDIGYCYVLIMLSFLLAFLLSFFFQFFLFVSYYTKRRPKRVITSGDSNYQHMFTLGSVAKGCIYISWIFTRSFAIILFIW